MIGIQSANKYTPITSLTKTAARNSNRLYGSTHQHQINLIEQPPVRQAIDQIGKSY